MTGVHAATALASASAKEKQEQRASAREGYRLSTGGTLRRWSAWPSSAGGASCRRAVGSSLRAVGSQPPLSRYERRVLARAQRRLARARSPVLRWRLRSWRSADSDHVVVVAGGVHQALAEQAER